jgi:dihydropteroate synthase
VDTTRATVARAALEAGADAINDVAAGEEDDAMLSLASERGCGIILMHRLRPPAQDRYSDRHDFPPDYPGGVVSAVTTYLYSRVRAALRAGVPRPGTLDRSGVGLRQVR